jgi:hypothetical protein
VGERGQDEFLRGKLAHRSPRRLHSGPGALATAPRGPGRLRVNEIVKDWVKAAGELSPGASLYFIDRLALNNDTDRADYLRLRYAKGPLVLHALRLELQRQKGSPEEGDRYFIALLRTYLKRHRYSWGTTRGLVETLDQLTGGNWQPWFERYVYGTEIPSLPK